MIRRRRVPPAVHLPARSAYSNTQVGKSPVASGVESHVRRPKAGVELWHPGYLWYPIMIMHAAAISLTFICST